MWNDGSSVAINSTNPIQHLLATLTDPGLHVIRLIGLETKMADILQTMFWNEFSWQKRFIFWFYFDWNLTLRVPLMICQYLVWVMSWPKEVTSITWTNDEWVHFKTLTALSSSMAGKQNGWHAVNDILKWISMTRRIFAMNPVSLNLFLMICQHWFG